MSYCYNCFREHNAPGPCPHCGYDPARDAGKFPQALPHGTILAGQFITGRVLGQGGFGITYLALDNRSGDRVALKEFLPDTMAGRSGGSLQVTAYSGDRGQQFQYGLDCFLDEAKTLAKFLGNPNIVGVRSYFQENGTAYFTMEYIEGVSLKALLRERGGRIDWEESVRLLLPVMNALEAVHRENLVHRDVTPDNIYISRDGQVKLLDFGAARYSLGDRSRSLDVVLKPGYAPKEQYTRRGRQGSYTDVYSLGACFYATITGTVPPEALDRMEEDDLVPPSSRGIKIPTELEDAILKALEVQAGDRYQTMAEFRAAIPELEEVRRERERLEQARLEQERLERERLEQARLEQARLEQERLEQARLEQARLERERLEQERLEQERLERERVEQERRVQERQEQERRDQEHQDQERLKEQGDSEKADEPKPQKRWLPFAGIGVAAALLLIVLCVTLWPKSPAVPNDDNKSQTGDTLPGNPQGEPVLPVIGGSQGTFSDDTKIPPAEQASEPEPEPEPEPDVVPEPDRGQEEEEQRKKEEEERKKQEEEQRKKQEEEQRKKEEEERKKREEEQRKKEEEERKKQEEEQRKKEEEERKKKEEEEAASQPTTVKNEPYTMVTSKFSVSGTYTGDWKDGKPNGKGTLTITQTDERWDYGDTLWSADWVNGLIEGYGQWRSAVDGAYDGNFSKGLKSGYGKMWFSDGTVYDGQWSKGDFVG